MPQTVQCPAMLVSAPASGQGKTTLTAALAHYHRRQGRKVRVFKTGPDFIDPQILAVASDHPVYQLDLWMMGETHCRAQLYRAALEADLILIEGVMGLYDGDSSSADLAQTLGVPVALVIDAQGMAQTFAAVAHGLAHYRPGGYPELHLQTLADNQAMKQALHDHHRAGKPIYAECGGVLYLLDSLADKDGQAAAMVGLLSGSARMQSRLVNLGMHSLHLDGGELRGHSFHHSQLETGMAPLTQSRPQRASGRAEAFYRHGALQASYLHLYFPFNPQLAAGLFA